MYIQSQFGGGGDIFSVVMWFAVMLVFFMFYPRLMLGQIMYKLERTAKKLEEMSEESKKVVLKKISNKPDKKLKQSVNRFFEFFSIEPVSLDPQGIVSKFDHIIRGQKNRFTYFVKSVAPKKNTEEQTNIEMGFAAGISLYQIAKVVRHYVELVKKTKNFQIGMILQMQLPMIEMIAKALHKGTKALSNGDPIGDGLGPLVAADLIGNNKIQEVEEDIVMAKTVYKGRNLFVMKAKGPGGRLGYPGKAIEKIATKNKAVKIITVDAAAKLEGEKTGSIAEGIGVAMGGIGVEKSYIEDAAVKNQIPLDSVVVKMSQEEAITPMRKAIKDAVPGVMESINRSLEETKKGSNIIVFGVGNTSGVGNNGKAANETRKWVDKNERKMKSESKKK